MKHIRGPLTLIQIACLIALGLSAWFLLERWTFVAAISAGILLATLYVEGVIRINEGDD